MGSFREKRRITKQRCWPRCVLVTVRTQQRTHWRFHSSFLPVPPPPSSTQLLSLLQIL